MNKTKKYLLQFIVLVFVLIGIITLYNMNAHSTKTITTTKQVEEVVQVQTPKTQEASSSHEKENTEESKQESTFQQTTDTKKEQSKESTTPQSSTEESTTQEPVQESVRVTIRGIDSIIEDVEVVYKEGLDAFDVLKSVCNQKGISLETTGKGITVYVSSINGLAEMEYGPMSGWKYKVNGQMYSKGAGQYLVKSGDHVEWFYDKA